MKRILALVISLLLVFALAGCGEEASSGQTDGTASGTQAAGEGASENLLSLSLTDTTVYATVTAVNDHRLTLQLSWVSMDSLELPEGESMDIPSREAGQVPSGEAGDMPELPSGEGGETLSGDKPELPSGETGQGGMNPGTQNPQGQGDTDPGSLNPGGQGSMDPGSLNPGGIDPSGAGEDVLIIDDDSQADPGSLNPGGGMGGMNFGGMGGFSAFSNLSLTLTVEDESVLQDCSLSEIGTDTILVITFDSEGSIAGIAVTDSLPEMADFLNGDWDMSEDLTKPEEMTVEETAGAV